MNPVGWIQVRIQKIQSNFGLLQKHVVHFSKGEDVKKCGPNCVKNAAGTRVFHGWFSSAV